MSVLVQVVRAVYWDGLVRQPGEVLSVSAGAAAELYGSANARPAPAPDPLPPPPAAPPPEKRTRRFTPDTPTHLED